ncbi:hypothetical protein AWM70_15960 [Paenibacillus yonginensis]|uniref:Diguanylate cyclase n=1 Tax=Paenibacillus yonginensis TaxID=1462996 RepID=A0A1B1N399_9BACL|nr:histidine kinase N-terminal 7TM domain-containing protein [Paenibacillus yonginensis]ANS75897.1 hypothetical protein AWM70_15960 [Paenibacillus yonginensis]
MGSFISNYIVIVSLSGVLNVLLAFLAYFRRTDFQGTKAFVAIAVTSAIYIFGYAVELSSSSLEEIRLWTKIEYLGLPFISPADLILVLYFVGLDKLLNRITLPLLFVIPAVSCLLALTNDYHHLLYRDMYLNMDAPFPTANIVMGPWYIVHGSYTFGCLCAGGCIILAKWNSMKHNYKWQMLTLLVGIILPSAASLAYLFGLSPYGMDPVPVVMSVTSTLYIIAIWSRGMLTAAPIARESLFGHLSDSVLVLDIFERVVDYNPAAEQSIRGLDASSIGKPLARLVEKFSPETLIFIQSNDPAVPAETQVEWKDGEKTFHYQLHCSPLTKRDGRNIGRIVKLTDITEQTMLQEKLQFMATRDSLTQIYNRGYWMDKSREALSACQKLEEPLAVILLDIDHFKNINDRYGHDIGDEALRHLVAVCRSLVHEEMPFGRYGGEEFVICLPGRNLDQAGYIAEMIRKGIEDSPLATPSQQLPITASFGVADETCGQTLEEMLSEADKALYQSKHGGRNRVHLARPKTVYP